MKSVVFRIRKQYYDMIVSGEKTAEYRPDSPFWNKRLLCEYPPTIAVFICGKRVHRRWIRKIEHVRTPDWFSSQGQQDVSTTYCFAIHLGEEAPKGGFK